MFTQKLLALFFLSASFSSVYGQNDTVVCPTVDKIRRDELVEWLPLYKENEELASSQDTAKFRKSITAFDVAKWSADYLESAHCFYRGNDPIVDRIVLGQDAWQPAVNRHWEWLIPYKFAECRSTNLSECLYLK